MCSPLRLVTKLTQYASDRGVPSSLTSLVSRPNCRHISRDLGDSACAFGAASLLLYLSMMVHLTVIWSVFGIVAARKEWLIYLPDEKEGMLGVGLLVQRQQSKLAYSIYHMM